LAEKAALITGGSSGIGLAIARALADDGYGVTVSARRPEKLEAAAEDLRSAGHDVLSVPANMVDEGDLTKLVGAHRDRFGRLDVLVNNAGVGIGSATHELQTKYVDMQLGVNLRAVVLMTRECLPMLREAGAEHGKALILNMASISGKAGQAWLSVYSATKAGVVAFNEAMNGELKDRGIKSTALCPGFVDTPMTDFMKEEIPAQEMIQVSDIIESVRFLLRLTPGCVVPEIVFTRPGGAIGVQTP
jgi:NAD(P)-dependent dehydrogenase (short-subunit alcohol dehydrogenase family)